MKNERLQDELVSVTGRFALILSRAHLLERSPYNLLHVTFSIVDPLVLQNRWQLSKTTIVRGTQIAKVHEKDCSVLNVKHTSADCGDKHHDKGLEGDVVAEDANGLISVCSSMPISNVLSFKSLLALTLTPSVLSLFLSDRILIVTAFAIIFPHFLLHLLQFFGSTLHSSLNGTYDTVLQRVCHLQAQGLGH
jgi:hypothetical protein